MAGKHWVLLAAICAAGCGNDKLIQVDGLPSAAKSIDFGEISVGTRASRVLAISDDGRAPVEIDSVKLMRGGKVFEAAPGARVVSGGGGKLGIALGFHPEEEGDFSDELVIRTSSVSNPELHVTLHGRAGPAAIRFDPSELDWGGVEKGDARALTVSVTNPTDMPVALRSSAPPDEFSLSARSVAPNSTAQLVITFHAEKLGDRKLELSAAPCPSCTAATLHGKARALESAIVMQPDPLQWSGVPVHHSQDASAMLHNVSWRDVKIAALGIDGSDFTVISGPRGQVLPAGQALPVTIRFAPQHVGPTSRTLTVRYHSFAMREGRGSLEGIGGGPQIAVTPLSLDFGDLPAGGKKRLPIFIQNAGQYVNLQVSASMDGAGFSDSLTGTASVQPGTSRQVDVDFAPDHPGSFSGTLHLASNDPATPDVAVTLSGTAHAAGPCTFSLTPRVLDFGNVPPPLGAVLGFRFEDTGRTECAVKDIQLDPRSDPAFFMPGGALVGGDLFPTDTFSAQVAFKSPGPGVYKGALVLTVNDPRNPHPHIPLIAHSQTSCLAAAPPYLDFGAVRFDCSAHPAETIVTNACSTPVTVNRIDIGQGTLPDFQITAAPTLPYTLNPGETFGITAEYSRAHLGQEYAPLYIQADNEPAPLLVPLLGEALHPGDQVDHFIQGSANEADVLFVVSNTNTMGEYQQRLASAVGQLIDAATMQGVDLHVGVTSTGLAAVESGGALCEGGANGGEAGRLIPADGSGPRIVTLNTGNGLTALQQNVEAGTCQNLEQGLESMRMALSAPLSDHADDARTPLANDGNLGFLRDEARLAVVVLADEDDHSGYDPATYAQFLKSLKGLDGAHRTALYAIVPKSGTMCETAGPPGDRFAEVARETGGAVYDICENDYGPFLAQLAQRGIGAQSIFPLSAAPNGNGMTVLLNGTQADGSNWYYDPNLNAVVFNPGFIPPAGTQIEVDYTSACP